MAIPKGTEIPSEGGEFTKFEQNSTTKIRITSDFMIGFQYFQADKTPMVSIEEPTELINPGKKYKSEELQDKAKQIWVASVYNFETKQHELLVISQSSIKKALLALEANKDWGDLKEYSISVNRDDSSSVVKYALTPSPKKALNKEEQAIVDDNPIVVADFFKAKEDDSNEDITKDF